LIGWRAVGFMTKRPVFEFIESLEDLKTVDETWRAFLDFAAQFGFTHGGLADMPAPYERIEDTTLCLSWPDEWRDRYFAQNYIAHDPANLHLFQTSLPYTWDEMLAFPYYSKRQHTIVHEASEFGLTTGLIVPLPCLGSGPALVTIAGDKIEMSPTDRVELHMAAMYAHARVRLLSGRKRRFVGSPHLSPRERECLQWAAIGKTDWEISEILSISERTAGAHIERVKEKYGVATRMQAVVHGLRCGAIRFDAAA
jgi:LuxR family quorum sensing-dependent transcriptional regulator